MALKFSTYQQDKKIFYGEDDAENLLSIDPKYTVQDYNKNKSDLVVFCPPSNTFVTGVDLSDEIMSLIDRMERSARHKDLSLNVKAIAIKHRYDHKLAYRVRPGMDRPRTVPTPMFLNLRIHSLRKYASIITKPNDPFDHFVDYGNVGNFAIQFTLVGIDGIARPTLEFADPAVSWGNFSRAEKYLNTASVRFEKALNSRPMGEQPSELFYDTIIEGLYSLGKFFNIAETQEMPFLFKQNSQYQTLRANYKDARFQRILRDLAEGYEDSRIAGGVEILLESMLALIEEVAYIRDNPNDEDAWRSFDLTDY